MFVCIRDNINAASYSFVCTDTRICSSCIKYFSLNELNNYFTINICSKYTVKLVILP